MISSGTLDERYLNWLYGQISAVSQRNPANSHWQLAVQLYKKRFDWSVPNDDNRVADGKDLRDIFLYETNEGRPASEWMDEDCSFLEMLVAFSGRIAFETDEEPFDWFWRLMDNLGISGFTDNQYGSAVEDAIDDILHTVINRQYKANGDGGLFPLRRPDEDQRKVELWYQMSKYLLERS